MTQPLIPLPGEKIRLADYDAQDHHLAEDKKAGLKELDANVAELNELSYRLYAENRRSVLLVLQGMDTSGKDGTIRQVMRGISPQMCQVTSFKQPSVEELDHDFLWRIHKAVPARGNIGIFNRSHYEDVLVVRVHSLVSEDVWRARYEQINAFEQMLTSGGMTILKIFLHISKDEQRERLQERLDNPQKRWKFSLGDLAERKRWDDYQRAYEEALTRCNTALAPWHLVPANRNWYRNMLVSRILRDTLRRLNPQFPPAAPDLPAQVE